MGKPASKTVGETAPVEDIKKSDSPCTKMVTVETIEQLRDAIAVEGEQNQTFESFCQIIKDKMFIDNSNSEIYDMKNAIEELILRLINGIVNSDDSNGNPFLSVSRLVPCGSMAENTCSWKYSRDPSISNEQYVEFDYLAVLNNATINDFLTKKTCDGFFGVKPSEKAVAALRSRHKRFVKDHDSALLLNACKMKSIFDLHDAISTLCDCMMVGVIEGLKKIAWKSSCRSCEKCRVQKKSGYVRLATAEEFGASTYRHCSLVMKWTSDAPNLHKATMDNTVEGRAVDHVFVLVDLLPAIEVADDGQCRPKGKEKPQSGMMGTFYLVPKVCSQYHQTCWKISNCLDEIKILKDIASGHRHAYMVAKYIVSIVFSDFEEAYYHSVNTYKLKTCFLHHSSRCSAPNERCVFVVLRQLAKYMVNQYLPNFSNGCNLLAHNLLADDRLDMVTCVLLGDCLMSVCETLMSLPIVSGQPLDPLKVIAILQTIRLWYHNAWEKCIHKNEVFVVDKGCLQERIAKMF